jgi:putative membrane protein
MTPITPPPPDAGTKLAVERTRLAYERTMMAWVRTATSLISFGFSIYKFFQLQIESKAVQGLVIGPREFALLMIITGLGALLLSSVQHRQSMLSLTRTYGPQPRSTSGVVAGFVSVMGVVALAAVVLRA